MKAYALSPDGTLPPAKKPSLWRRFVDRHLPALVIYLMVVTLVAVVLFPYLAVTVPSGQVGVLWKRFGGGTVLDPRQLRDEGLRFILPWNELFIYDLRLQSITQNYNAISSDGVSLDATMNVRFRLQRDAIPVLHQAIGPNYIDLLVRPGIGSLAREVMAQYTAEQVYSTARQEIQDKIRGLAEDEAEREDDGARGRGRAVSRLDAGHGRPLRHLVYGIELPALVVSAINRKTEQYYISEEYKFRVERESGVGTQEDRGPGHPRVPDDRLAGHLGFLPDLARHRGDASALAIHQLEGGDHRQRQGRTAGDPRQCECGSAGAGVEHGAHRQGHDPEGKNDRGRTGAIDGESARRRIQVTHCITRRDDCGPRVIEEMLRRERTTQRH